MMLCPSLSPHIHACTVGHYELQLLPCHQLSEHFWAFLCLLVLCMMCMNSDFAGKHVHCVSKKFPPLNSLQLCHILTDSQNFCTAESAWNLLQNLYDIAHLTLGMLLQYLGKLKIQIFADIQPIWKKMQAYYISLFVVRPQFFYIFGA